MPVPTPSSSRFYPEPPLFPPLTVGQIEAARLSAWYDTFEDLTIPSTVIDLESIGEKDLFLEVRRGQCIFGTVKQGTDVMGLVARL